jgi:hypothetical protein
MESLTISEPEEPTQDGGNSSLMKVVTSSMLEKATRFLKFQETRTLKLESLMLTERLVVRTRDGELSMLIKLKRMKLRV